MIKHTWTEEQAQTYIENYQNMTYKQLTDLINSKYQLNLSRDQVRYFGRKNDMRTSNTRHHFKKGNKLWVGGKDTQFKKGHVYKEYPLGTEKINEEGYTIIKVAMEGKQREKWKFKHRVIYERFYGALEKGEMVIFLDGDKRNFDIDNLEKISRGTNAMMNVRKWHTDNAEITKVRILQAKLMSKRAEMEERI